MKIKGKNCALQENTSLLFSLVRQIHGITIYNLTVRVVIVYSSQIMGSRKADIYEKHIFSNFIAS